MSTHKTVIVKRQLEPGVTPFAIEKTSTALVDHPYMSHMAPIAIFNGRGSGCKLNIKLLNTRPLTGPQSLVSQMSIQRITGVTGGFEVPEFQLDSGAAPLPSQVLHVFNPSSVTGATTLRNTFICSGANFTRALSKMTAMWDGDSRKGFDSGEFIRSGGDADCQKHVLREGQGLAVTFSANGPTFCFGLTMVVRNQATGETYRYNDMIEPRFMSGQVAWALLNGSGSGVVLELSRVQIRELGTDEVPMITYEPIDGIDWSSEDAIYLMADSAETLPAEVFIKKNCVTARAGSKYGALITSPMYRRVTLAEAPFGPGIAGGPQISRRGIFSPDMDTRGSAPITLSEGQGIALFIRNASAQLFHEFTATVDIENVNPSPADIAAAIWSREGRSLTT